MRALAWALAVLTVAFVSPALSMLWGTVLGAHFSGSQQVAAYALAAMGILSGGACVAVCGEIRAQR